MIAFERKTSRAGAPAPFRLLWVALILALSAGVGDAGATEGRTERILSFSSRIIIDPDGTMTVAETIRVRATGEQIKRGIYRDFPTTYRDRAGNRFVVGFAVVSVARDDQPEGYHTEKLTNGIRVYMGRKEHLLPPGEHRYTLIYTTDRQLGFFEKHDELYWNVTGNDWVFPIDQAEARVQLPPGVPAETLALAAYTGPSGAQGRDYRAAAAADGTAVFRTTRSLAPHEGLTIVVGWPKGFVTEPTAGMKTVRAIRDNLTLLVAGLGLVFILGYYLLVWAAVGKDPAGGSIMPLYTPPDGLSPAAMRFVSEMGYDDKILAAAIVDMAVKRHIEITDIDGTYSLIQKDGSQAKLSAEERKIATELFRGDRTIALARQNHRRLAAAKNAIKSSLALTFEKTHFVSNRKAFVTGAVISAAAVAVTFLSARDQGEAVFLGVWLTGWSIGVFFLAALVLRLWRQVFAAARSLGTRVGSIGAAVFMTLFALPFFGAEVFALVTLAGTSPALAAFPLAAAALNLIFFHLLKAPTLLGRRVLDRIEGFKMFLGATEGDRLERLNPDGRTPEQFEKFLPYAIALGVEQQWAERFAGVLSRAARPEGGGYRPAWYSGSWDSGRVADFAGSVGSSLSGAISSAAAAPGSRSGGGGGGSSGGGGGGGGGGGW